MQICQLFVKYFVQMSTQVSLIPRHINNMQTASSTHVRALRECSCETSVATRSTRASPRMSRRRNGPLQMGHSCLFFSRSVRQVLRVRDYGAAQQCCAMSDICCMQRDEDDRNRNELHMRSWELTNTGSGSRRAARTVASGCRCCRQTMQKGTCWPQSLELGRVYCFTSTTPQMSIYRWDGAACRARRSRTKGGI